MSLSVLLLTARTQQVGGLLGGGGGAFPSHPLVLREAQGPGEAGAEKLRGPARPPEQVACAVYR